MSVLVGVHDPRGTEALGAAVAAAAGVAPGEVVRVGPLAVAGAEAPGRSGAVACLFSGELHDTPETAPALAIARGYEREGTAFLAGLRGSYQLILWDGNEQEAIVAQDHLSTRAIFYHSQGPRVTFASDIAPLLAALERRPAPDPQSVPRWITDRSLPDGLTLYENVRRLGMGWSLALGRERWSRRRIWELRYARPERIDAEEAGARLRAGVERAVRRRVELDGSTGILMSGGFDSGTLASTAAPILREAGHQLSAYSTVFPGDPWDESPWVDVLTRELGLNSTRATVRGGALATALRFQTRWELPQPSPGSISDQPLVARARRDGLRVLIDGQGGDELFAASPYLLADHVLRGRWGAALRLMRRFPNTGDELAGWQARAMLKHWVVKGALPHAAHGLIAKARRRSDYADEHWLTPASRRRAEELDDPWAWKRGARGKPRWWSLLSYLLVGARELSGMPDYLRRRGEIEGVTSRQPLIDVDLVELMLRMPPELAFSPDYDRALARGAMRGIVPEPVRLPIRKSNYAPLMHRTLAVDDIDGIRRILGRRDAELGAYVDLECMRRELLERVPAHGETGWVEWGYRIWGLVTVELWLQANALGSDFGAWAERLALPPPQVEFLAAGD
jgi:asparagine synthase (glutamine-hydrolysing)